MSSPTDHAVQGPEDSSSGPTRAGYVTLVGRPNAGKSTLLNALLGQKLSIVTAKAQTTWQRVTGIGTRDGVQMIFLDTPGLLDARNMLQRSMLLAAEEAIGEADVVLLVLDPATEPTPEERDRIRSALEHAAAPLVIAVNKIDIAGETAVDARERWARDNLSAASVHRISALNGTGLESLETELRDRLPQSPFYYPPDEIASDPVRFFVAELIRETVFEHFHQEIPYSVFVKIEEYRGSQTPVYIGATIFVERNSQKGILVGKGGQAIRRLGQESRSKIEAFIGESVYLDLWVKVLAGWRRRRDHLQHLGFKVPSDHETSPRR